MDLMAEVRMRCTLGRVATPPREDRGAVAVKVKKNGQRKELAAKVRNGQALCAEHAYMYLNRVAGKCCRILLEVVDLARGRRVASQSDQIVRALR